MLVKTEMSVFIVMKHSPLDTIRPAGICKAGVVTFIDVTVMIESTRFHCVSFKTGQNPTYGVVFYFQVKEINLYCNEEIY